MRFVQLMLNVKVLAGAAKVTELTGALPDGAPLLRQNVTENGAECEKWKNAHVLTVQTMYLSKNKLARYSKEIKKNSISFSALHLFSFLSCQEKKREKLSTNHQ